MSETKKRGRPRKEDMPTKYQEKDLTIAGVYEQLEVIVGMLKKLTK